MKKGFLLFEVMVSIVIISIGILFITRLFSSSTDSIKRSLDVFKVSLLLEEKMWELEEKGKIPREKSSGDFKEHEGYAWEIEAEPLEDENSFELSPKLNIVRLRAFKEKDRKSTEYSLATYLVDEF